MGREKYTCGIFLIVFISFVLYFFLAATEEGCQLSLPARTYAVAFPVSGMIFLNIVSLIRTVVFIKQLGQVLIY